MIGAAILIFLAGIGAGVLTSAICSGRLDDFMEWRKRRHEQKGKNHL